MTTITYTEDNNIHIAVRGHSGYAESGADIVCSAISLMIISFVDLLDDLEQEDKIKILSFEQGDGELEVEYNDPMGFTIYPVKMMRIGFLALQEEFPSYVKVEWGETDF